MAYTAAALIKIAQAEIGYKEKASNSQLDSKTANAGSNNYTKYARDLYEAGYYNGNKQGYAYCDVFVDWCFYQLCGKNKTKAESMECQTGNLGAGCTYSRQYYKTAGRLDNTPKVGDQVFFKSGSEIVHTGIVETVTDSQITTIEGNSSNQVKRNTYSRSNSKIDSYGHPKYDDDTSSTSGSTSTSTAASTASTLPTYTNGKTYTLQVDRLNVRKAAGTSAAKVTYANLTTDGQKHAYSNGQLKKGTKVTCKATKTVDGDVWMQIPSGWIAAYYNGKYYVK